MSILIKGMAMPKSCETCELSSTDSSGFFGCCVTGYIVMRKRGQDRPSWCPLVEVPPHGDLIDRDALNNAFTGMRFNADGLLFHYGDRKDWYLKGSEVETLITNATTIIESEGEE